MTLDVNYAQSSLVLWFAGNLPCSQSFSFSINITFAPQAVLSENINLLDYLGSDFQATHIKSWESGENRINLSVYHYMADVY